MNARLDVRRRHRPWAAALETTLAAGGWTLAPVVIGVLAGPLLVRITGDGKAIYAGVVLAALFAMLWAMLAGARLVGLCANAAAQHLPYWRHQAWRHGLAALSLVVLLPAALLTLGSPVSYALAVAALGASVALGLFWVSMPPWLGLVLIVIGATARWLPVQVDGATLRAWLGSAAGLGAAALALLAASAACWAWVGSRRGAPGRWSTPVALTPGLGMPLRFQQAQQAGYRSALFAMDTPVGSDLRRAPQQALAVALGPGFGRSTWEIVLATQGPVVAVALLWLLLGSPADGSPHIGLAFAPLMVFTTAFAPTSRLLTLFLRPALGLHELALLPRLPRRPALSLSAQLGRQIIARALPALAVMAGFGLAIGAPRLYYHLLLWSSAAGLFLFAGMVLLSLHSRPARWATGALAVAFTLTLLVTMMLAMSRPQVQIWLLPAWYAATIAGVTLHGIALRRLQARPHPWLQN